MPTWPSGTEGDTNKFPCGKLVSAPSRGRQKPQQPRSRMRHQLKPKTPSARARLRYITRAGLYRVGRDGPRDDLRATGSAYLPAWAGGDAERFWSAADGHERANARRCLELELNLPRELDTAQQVAAVQDYLARLSAEAGPMPCTWAIHDAGDGNPHCHLMLQERPLDSHERSAETWFRRANRQQPERGGAIKSTWWHDREHVFWSRALWADACNQALIRAGHEARFDHRAKSVQRDEALRAGDLRRAAALDTLTERHEGVVVAGMRRRVERGEIAHEDLPGYAQQLIEQNDRARTYNCWLRDWARTAPEAELADFLVPALAELRERENPGAHVAAWVDHQHAPAFDEDRQRAVAAALDAGEVELRTAAQLEAVELAGLIEVEQDDQLGALLAIERDQAHGAALVEDRARETTQRAAVLLRQIDQLAEQVLDLGGPMGLKRLRYVALPKWLSQPDSCPPLHELVAMREQLRDEVLPAARHAVALADHRPALEAQTAVQQAIEPPMLREAEPVDGLDERGEAAEPVLDEVLSHDAVLPAAEVVDRGEEEGYCRRAVEVALGLGTAQITARESAELLKAVDQLAEQVLDLGGPGGLQRLRDGVQLEVQRLRAVIAQPAPWCYAVARELQAKARVAERAARDWRAAHRVRSSLADAAGITLPIDRTAAEARQAYRVSVARADALTWLLSCRQNRQHLRKLEAGLPALQARLQVAELARLPRREQQQRVRDDLRQVTELEARMTPEARRDSRLRRAELLEQARPVRTPVERAQICLAARALVEPAQRAADAGDRAALDEAARALRRAVDLVNNALTWCAHGERLSLFAVRREIKAQQQALERLREVLLPPPAEVATACCAASARLDQVKRWRETEDAGGTPAYRPHGPWNEEPQWVEFERNGERYGHWDNEPSVIYRDDGCEWVEAEAVPDPAPRGPRLG